MSSQNLNRAFSSATSDRSLQAVIDEHVRRDGFQANWVVGLRFVRQQGVSPAFGFGMRVPSFLGYPEFPIGCIYISDNYCDNFPEEELEFIVLHELGHIVNSHSVVNLIFYGLKGIFVGWIAEAVEVPVDVVRNLIGLIKFFVGSTIEEQITAQKEIEADKYAVMRQGRKEPAISVLMKITNGNVDTPTHLTSDGSFKTTAITGRQRIEAIRNMLSYYQ